MAFMAKLRAQEHYAAGTRILMNLHQSSYVDRGLAEAEKRVGKVLSSVSKEPDEEAVKHLRKSLGKKVSSSIPRDLEKAIKHLQKAVKLNPSFAGAFHNLAHAWYNLAEYNVAATAIQGFGLNPQEAEDSITGALEFALEAVDKALAIRYEFPQAHNTRATVLAKLFRLNEAMEAAELALSQYPDYEKARDNREKIKEMIRERAAIPGYKNESDFLEKYKEKIRTQSIIWKDLRK